MIALIKIENIEVYGIESAIRAMRMPMNSHILSDSGWCDESGDLLSEHICVTERYKIGEKDMELMKKLYKGGSPHSKFMRQITCSFTLTAPVFVLSEFDTYKVGVTRNSSSFMHKGVSKPFSKDDFGFDNSYDICGSNIDEYIVALNALRDMYIASKDMKYFLALREMLPMGYYYTSEITTNYAAIANMITWRKNHRLPAWRCFCETMLNELPYISDIMD